MKKKSYVAREVRNDDYKDIIHKLVDLLEEHEREDEREYLFWMIKSIIVSYCQPDITFNRIGKMLSYVGQDNLEILNFMDELKKVKTKIDERKEIV